MKHLLVSLFLLAFVPVLAASDSPPEHGTLNDQYRSVTSDIDVYDGYRMVKVFAMDKVWKAAMDSLAWERAQVKKAAQAGARFQQTIRELEGKLQVRQATVDELVFAGEHIRVLGRDMSKGGFITGVLITGGVLVTLLVLSLLSTRVSFRAVAEAQRAYDNVSKEFDEYKHQAVEKQIRLSRELQTERNRVTALKIS